MAWIGVFKRDHRQIQSCLGNHRCATIKNRNMALSETEITLIVVGSCGGVLVAVFVACLIIFCCFRRDRDRKRMDQPSYMSRSGFREGRAKFLDYERRGFRPPPPYTESTSVHSEFDKRSGRSEKIYSTAYDGRKIPLRAVDYDSLYAERRRSSGFYPHIDKGYGFYPPLNRGIKDDRPSLLPRENTVYIPYSPEFVESFISEKIYPKNYYPRLSIKELDDDDTIADEIKYKRTDPKPGLTRYELDYL